jgi:hypothetical protein
LLGEVEDTRDVLHLAFRDLEHFLEGVDLVHGDDAVGLGHLGAKRDHADGECDLIFCLAFLIAVAIDGVMAGHATHQRSDRAANGEPCGARTATFHQIRDILATPTN